jgi:general secretion pathway protein K
LSSCPGKINLSPFSRERGFVLVLVLWAVVIVLLLAAALDTFVERRLAQAQAIRERTRAELDAYSTEQTLLYLLATRRYTRAGLRAEADATQTLGIGGLNIEPAGDEIAMDSRAYRGLGSVLFSLQDDAGLLPLNAEDKGGLADLLTHYATDEAHASRLLDALSDYVDANTLRRLNGAEADDYLDTGLPAPANYYLRTPAELSNVLGWREWLGEHPEVRLYDWFSVGRGASFNPNVAPEALLATLPGISAEDAARLVLARHADPFRSLADLSARSGVPLQVEEEQFRFFPSEFLRIRSWMAGAPRARTLEIQLTPLGMRGPWQVRSSYLAPQQEPREIHETPGTLFGTSPTPAR